MSRRARRRQSAPERVWWKRLAWGLVGLVLAGAIAVYIGARSYLHSEGFRTFLARKVNAKAGVDGAFKPFEWQGLAVETDGYAGAGEGRLRRLEVEGLHTEIGLGGIGHGVWQVENTRVRRIHAEIDATRRVTGKPEADDAPRPPAKKGKKAPGWLPREVEFHGMTVDDVSAGVLTTRGAASLSNMAVEVRRDGGADSYKMETSGGLLSLPSGPVREVRLDAARLRYHDDMVYLSKCEASAWSNARLRATGEWNVKTRRHSIEGELTGVKCDEVLPPNWARCVLGNFSTTFRVEGEPGAQSAEGRAILADGMLTALPVLDSLAAYLDTARFRSLPLAEARADWRKTGDCWEFQDIVISSHGLIRIEGGLTIDGGALSGTVQLGVSPAVLARLPGAEMRVFNPGALGMWWTPVRLSGTTEEPEEDLTDRLITAAGIRMIESLPETGERVLKFSRTVLDEKHAGKLEKTLEKDTDFIRENEKLIHGAKGVLEGLLGK